MGKFLVTLLLGWLGVHKFMEKKTILGVIYLFSFGLFGIGWLVDIIIAATKLKSKSTKNNVLRIDVVGEYFRKGEISSLVSGNPLYNLSDANFVQKIEPGKHIYQFKYREAEAQLVPEPNNPHDANAIKVLIDDVHVGYIPSERCVELKKIMKRIKSVNAHIHGGNHKYHSNYEVFKTESDFAIELYITL